MSSPLVDKIVEAVLYEGYVLYPYRPSVKNRHRWTFGGIYPRAYAESQKGSDPWMTQTQCLLIGTPKTTLEIKVRFLHLTNRTVARALTDTSFQPVDSLTIDDHTYQTWQEAVERTIDLGSIPLSTNSAPQHHPFSFPATNHYHPLHTATGQLAGQITRDQDRIEGSIDLSIEQLAPDLFRLTLQISNHTASTTLTRDSALMHSLVSAHTILTLTDGQFISLTDPPAPLRQPAADCRNIGSWPVLVGHPGQTDTLLASPIILPDYPEIAPESPGSLFDSTEIDEILTLRILTLTDDEKRQAAAIDPRVETLLTRTESLAREQLMSLHGVVRGLRPIHSEEQHA